MRHVLIIGNGIAGVTCARQLRKKSNDRITMISAETEHFFSRTALMYIYMGHMKFEHTKPYEDFFWSKNRIDLIYDYVTGLDTDKKTVYLKEGSSVSYDILILATGSVTQKFDWPGQDLKGVQGLYSYQDLQSMELDTKNIQQAVICGGGLIGVEMAEMLHTRKIPVTMLIKDDRYWASVLPAPEAALVAKQIEKNGIRLLYNSQIREMTGDAGGRVSKLITTGDECINCQFVGIATGVKPNITLARNTKIQSDKGILVNEYFETSCQDVYAIGDCVQFITAIEGRKKIEQVWYTGRMHGETLALTLSDKRTAYRPGPWFNSAKFFDLEYQTYGLISGKLNEDEKYFYWQHPKKDIGFGVVYHEQSKLLKGVNSYGMRLRHACFDRWLKEKCTADAMLSMLDQAIFDPEFTKNNVEQIIAAYNVETGSSIKRKKSLFPFFTQ